MLILKWSNECNAIVDDKVIGFVNNVLELHSKHSTLTVSIGQDIVLTAFRAAIAEGKIDSESIEFHINGEALKFNSIGRFMGHYPKELEVLENLLGTLIKTEVEDLKTKGEKTDGPKSYEFLDGENSNCN